ncbi:hypothetical protein [Trichothermofontia sp.]
MNAEPTLRDIAEQLDRLEADVTAKFDRWEAEQAKFNDRFTTYQQATQWVVQLAFALIASATVTVVVSSVFAR